MRQPARDRRIRPWPYAGPVTIEEAAADRAQGHLFILDGWQVVRALAYSSDGAITCLWEPTPSFDVDQYRILRRYLSVHGQQARPLDEASAQRLLADGGAAEWEAGALDGYHSEAQDVERAD